MSFEGLDIRGICQPLVACSRVTGFRFYCPNANKGLMDVLGTVWTSRISLCIDLKVATHRCLLDKWDNPAGTVLEYGDGADRSGLVFQ